MTYPATVCTPYLWAGPAVELANRTWRKKVLPVGQVEYKGRMLNFTRNYLNDLCQAFRDGAYDQVSFQLADSQNSHTNDPERHRGFITDLQLSDDGLYATAQVTEAGERVLAENPQLGVSARIVENYARSDGKFYPAAIQHVLGTLDPRIPQLGAWEPVSLSNDGQVLIDLSTSAWAGEPGPSWDLAASAVGARLGSAGSSYYDDADMDEILAASLPQGYADTTGLAEFARTFDMSNEIELTRQAEDTEPLPVRAEDRVAHLLDRAARGTYTPQGSRAYSFAAQGGTTGMETCGSTVPGTNYCMERYHAPGCGSAATPDIIEALRPAMADLAQRPLLDADGLPWIDAEFGSQMTATDFVESATGVRLGDASLFETGRSRRELVTPARIAVFGDPDDPDAMPLPVAASTARTAAALAAQSGITTPADTARQQAAWKEQHARLSARIGSPRHADFRADLSTPVHEPSGLAEFGPGPLFGSLQAYSRGAA